MREKIKTVYYCDYCSKRYLIKSACEKHEKHCTANIDRDCRMCNMSDPENLRELIQKYNNQFDVHTIEDNPIFGMPSFETYEIENSPKAEDILEDVDGCPMCALTIIRKLKYPIDWDYKKQIEIWWNDNRE